MIETGTMGSILYDYLRNKHKRTLKRAEKEIYKMLKDANIKGDFIIGVDFHIEARKLK
jgi:hypothetical protein